MNDMTTLPRGRTMTRADLEALPDDGWRHELVDGALVMTPAPQWRYQSAVVRLLVTLDAACPADLRVVVAPFSVVLGPDTVVQPDLLVAPRSAITDTGLDGPPRLAIEVLSPSTTHIDLGLKESRYAAARCPSYWVVDPALPSTSRRSPRGSSRTARTSRPRPLEVGSGSRSASRTPCTSRRPTW